MGKIDNLYQLARRARVNGDGESAKNYYAQIIVENPNDWEAVFYNAYYSIYDGELSRLSVYATQMKNCIYFVLEELQKKLNSSEFKLLAGMADGSSVADTRNSIEEVVSNCHRFASSIYDEALRFCQMKHADYRENQSIRILTNADIEMLNSQWVAVEILYLLGDALHDLFEEEQYKRAIIAWERANELHKTMMKHMQYTKENRENAKEMILCYANKIKSIDSSYEIPEVKTSGCYIATSIYGSYDCPQVWTLRRFRDETLASSWYGKLFIHVYYLFSPSLVKWIGNTKCFKKVWKYILDKFVKKLNENGVENTLYEDSL